MRCPVLTYRMLIRGVRYRRSACSYAMCGTDLAYAPTSASDRPYCALGGMSRRACYGLSGTDRAYDAFLVCVCDAECGTDRAAYDATLAAVLTERMLLRSLWYWPSVCCHGYQSVLLGVLPVCA
eukprot:1260607-Rhodomonas_salina.1